MNIIESIEIQYAMKKPNIVDRVIDVWFVLTITRHFSLKIVFILIFQLNGKAHCCAISPDGSAYAVTIFLIVI